MVRFAEINLANFELAMDTHESETVKTAQLKKTTPGNKELAPTWLI